ncbi:MAG: polysaccharide deacetylase family protein [Anaerolineae bacterium]|nr:polysaccharide deacetylase family protein [Anaerolineae bacterium]
MSLLALLLIVSCQRHAIEPTPASDTPVSAPRVHATRWPTPSPTATHTPLPTLTPAATRTATATPLPDLTLAQLGDLAYPHEGVEGGLARLTGGLYETAQPGGAGGLRVILADMVTFGDLDGDRRDDAVALLITERNVAAPRWQLAAVLHRGGTPEVAATTDLGDDVVPQLLAIQSGRITLGMMRYGPDDLRGSPSQDARHIYELVEDELTLVTAWEGPRQQPVVPRGVGATEIPFAPGTAATRVRGSLLPLGGQVYTLPGTARQSLALRVVAPHDQVTLSVRGLADGVLLTGVLSDAVSWDGELTMAQDYAITLASMAGAATSYVLEIAADPPPATRTPVVPATPSPTVTSVATVTLTQDSGLTTTVGSELTAAATPGPTLASPGSSAAGSQVLDGSTVYLTFDVVSGDGPWFDDILPLLAASDARATFFLPSAVAERSPGIAGALVAAGHDVGLYAVTDPTLHDAARQEYVAALTATRAGLAQAKVCVRPFYGALDATTRALLAETGFHVALWDVDMADLRGLTADAALARLLAQVRPGTVLRVPLAGESPDVVGVLARLVPTLDAQGYEFAGTCR